MGAAASAGKTGLSEKELYDALLPSFFIPDVDLNGIKFDLAAEAWKRVIENRAQRYLSLKCAEETKDDFETKSCLMWFYDSFYELSYTFDESSRTLYKGNIKIQSKALVGMIGMILNLFKAKDFDKMTKSFQGVAKGHCNNRGVRSYQYPIVGEVLLSTFSNCLDENEWDEETSLAWRQMFSLVLQITLPAAIREENLLTSEQQEEAATQIKMHMTTKKGIDSTKTTVESSKRLGNEEEKGVCESPSIRALSPRHAVLSKEEFRECTILSTELATHDTYLIRVQVHLSSKMEVASYVLIEGEDSSNPYTPISDSDDVGCIDLLIKRYPEGRVSRYLTALQVGDKVKVKGPFPKLKYTANMKKSIGMIAGGTGITPMIQVLKEILNNKDDTTQVSLLFANKTEEDILLKSTLDDWAAKYSSFKVKCITSKTDGYITKEILGETMPPPGADNLVLVCGPVKMMESLSGVSSIEGAQGPLEGILRDMEYTESEVFKF